MFPNLFKVVEHLTIKLSENPLYLVSKLIFKHNIWWISNFLGSTCGPGAVAGNHWCNQSSKKRGDLPLSVVFEPSLLLYYISLNHCSLFSDCQSKTYTFQWKNGFQDHWLDKHATEEEKVNNFIIHILN